MIVVWRIEKAKYSPDAAKGIGAFTIGGRWNSPGKHAVYTSSALSLALLEILVHSPSPTERRVARVFFRIELPDSAVEEIPLSRLPRPFCPITPDEPCRKIGDAWLAGNRSAALRVPSAVVPTEFNYILNPGHPSYTKSIKWWQAVPFHLDGRLCLDP